MKRRAVDFLSVRSAALGLAVLGMVVLALGSRALAAPQTVSLTGDATTGYPTSATATVYADGFTLTYAGGSTMWQEVDIVNVATDALAAYCPGSNCTVTSWNGSYVQSATVTGLQPGTSYGIGITELNTVNESEYESLTPNLTTQAPVAQLTLSGPTGYPPANPDQVNLTLSVDTVEEFTWTLSQSQLGPSGALVAVTSCPAGATLSGGSCLYSLAVASGGSLTLTTTNQQAGGSGYVYRYTASAGPYSTDTVPVANAPAAAVSVAASSATLTWPALGNGAEVEALGGTSAGGCGGGLSSGWLGTATASYTFSGLTPDTAYAFCLQAQVPGAPLSSGGWLPTWWVGASPATAWTLAEPPTAPAISGVGQGGFTLSWSGNGNPAGTTYQWSVVPAGQDPLASSQDLSTATSVAIATDSAGTAIACGETYSLSVQAENGAGLWTGWQSAGSVATLPCAPTSVSGSDGGLGWSNTAGRGWVSLSWSAVPGATGYRVWVFDGNQYDAIDVGDATTWDSRTWLGYPSEASIASWANNSVCADPYLPGAEGNNLRDDPNGLYLKTCGTTYDSAHSYWFRVSAYDASGDSGIDWAVGYFPTLPTQTDTTSPALSSVSLNGGKTYAYSQSVELNLIASDDLSGICTVATSPDNVSWTSAAIDGCSVGQVAPGPTSYTYDDTVQLTAGPGTKTEYVKVQDAAGNWSAVATATVYVQAPPGPMAGIEIDNGLQQTSSTAVTLDVQATDILYADSELQMRFSNDGSSWSAWTAYAATAPWSIAGSPGPNTVYLQVQDPAGGTGQAYASISYDSAASQVPAGAGTACTYDAVAASCTPSPIVTASFSVPAGSVSMETSFDGTDWSQPEDAKGDVALVLPSGDGLKAVFARYFNQDNVATAAGPDYFVLDSTPPAISSLGWLNDAAVTDGGAATLVVQATDNITAAVSLQVAVSGAASWSGILPPGGAIPLTLSGSGYVTVTVTVRDQAGNSASQQIGIYN